MIHVVYILYYAKTEFQRLNSKLKTYNAINWDQVESL